jgi:hypothetical protein
VLFDRSQVENALEIVIGFSAKDGEVTQAKSELIVAVHDGVQAEFATAPDDNPAWAGGGVRVYEKPPGNTEH